MSPVLAALAGMLVAGGLVVSAAGALRSPGRPVARPTRWRRRRPGARTAALAAVGAGLGVGVWLTTGWVLAVVVVPAVVAGLPWLLAAPSTATAIARLEAMAEWARGLAGVLQVGVGLEQAIAATRRSAPAAIRADVDRLVARLDARRPTEGALRAFADDLDDATGDLLVAGLVLASRRRGAGLSALLTRVGDTVAGELRARRALLADQARPRAAARWITGLTVGFLALLAAFSTALDPYRSPGGQVVLAVLLAVFAGCLVALRRLTTTRPLPRLLGAPGRGGTGRPGGAAT
ncbi:MAG: type II secretion system F family protein [Kineosporiaceae bacterium]